MRLRVSVVLLLLALITSGLPMISAQEAPLKVVATYSILGDLVQNVAGDNIELTVLVGPDGDSHVYEPTPQDLVTLSQADILFENGLEFEMWLDDLYESSGSTAQRIAVSEGITPLAFAHGHDHDHEGHDHSDEHDHDHEGHDHGDDHDHDHEGHDHGDDHDHSEVSDLSTWQGDWISFWALGLEVMQPAIEAITASMPELTADQVVLYMEEGNYTSFDTMNVTGETVTYNSASESITCDYVHTGNQPSSLYPEVSLGLFVTSDQACSDYRYLLLMAPHASEEGSSPHFHMRYGSTSFVEIEQDPAAWYPSIYYSDTSEADMLNSWIVNARTAAVYIAMTYGIAYEQTAEEIAAEAAASALPSTEGHKPRRLLVSDGVEGVVSVVDFASGEVIETFDINTSATLYTSPSGRYAFAVQPYGDIVNVIDSGVELEAHNDHYHTHVGDPKLLDYAIEGPTPIHFVINGQQIVVFTDGDGNATLFSEANIKNAHAETTVITANTPHHGVGAALDDVMLISRSTEDNVSGVDVVSLDGNVLQSFDGYTDLHGETHVDNGFAFAVGEGVLVITRAEGETEFSSYVIPYPTDNRSWTLTSDHHNLVVGNYGSQALVVFDIAAQTSSVIELEGVEYQVFAVHPDDPTKIIILALDGNLYVIDSITGEIEANAPVIAPFVIPEQWTDPRPSFTTIAGHALVSEPSTGNVYVVHLEGLEVETTYEVGGAPVNMTAFGYAPPARDSHDHDHNHDDEGHDHGDDHEDHDHDHEGHDHGDHDHHGHDHGEFDPHVWHDVQNAIVMVENIRAALVATDAANAETYNANAAAYTAELETLDAYIREQVAIIPEANRVMITTHESFAYFGDEYGFIIDSALGAVSTEVADPSAGALAELITEIQAYGVPALFAENIANSALIQQLANETGITVAPALYSDALGQAGTPGETYIGMIRYNVETIVAALGS